MKKSLTVMSALLMLASAGAGISVNQVVGNPATAQAASLNAAKLANGRYSVQFKVYGSPYIKALTLGGKTGTVKQATSGNTYTFTKVDLTKTQTIGFSLAVPMNGQTMTMQEAATLQFKTNTLKATSKTTKKAVALSTKRVKAAAKKVSGTTTKGAKVTVKHNQTTLGRTTTKKTAYTVKLKKAVKKSWKLKVTATKAGYKPVTKTVTVK
ncbi:cell surface protein [Levilactobacillus brevis]|nr:cell surface protein [Levilactobacillus brevis]